MKLEADLNNMWWKLAWSDVVVFSRTAGKSALSQSSVNTVTKL